METFIVRYPNAFSSEECKTIIDDINSSNLIPGTVIDLSLIHISEPTRPY